MSTYIYIYIHIYHTRVILHLQTGSKQPQVMNSCINSRHCYVKLARNNSDNLNISEYPELTKWKVWRPCKHQIATQKSQHLPATGSPECLSAWVPGLSLVIFHAHPRWICLISSWKRWKSPTHFPPHKTVPLQRGAPMVSLQRPALQL